MFTKKNGARKKIQKVLIVVTDTKETKKPVLITKHLAKKGILVVTVGVGKKFNVKELKKNGIGNKTIFHAKDFKTLLSKTFLANVTKHSCEKPKG